MTREMRCRQNDACRFTLVRVREIATMWLRLFGGWLITAALLTGLGNAAAATPPGGVYAIVDAVSPAQDNIAAQALATPGVDGLLIHLRWNRISPTLKQYDWTSLDRVVTLAMKAGKRFEIGIVTGGALPGWAQNTRLSTSMPASPTAAPVS